MQQVNLKNKAEIRKTFLSIRKSLSSTRKKEASFLAFEKLKIFKEMKKPILSFASFASEIDLWLINYYLAEQDLLLLPKIVGETIKIYHVVNPSEELQKSSFGPLEPNPNICKEYSDPLLSVILVPGIAFDNEKNRLGYGKGYYDFFLKCFPSSLKIGVGFKEQLTVIPIEDHDQKLDEVYLF